jgi:hypothetical protein
MMRVTSCSSHCIIEVDEYIDPVPTASAFIAQVSLATLLFALCIMLSGIAIVHYHPTSSCHWRYLVADLNFIYVVAHVFWVLEPWATQDNSGDYIISIPLIFSKPAKHASKLDVDCVLVIFSSLQFLNAICFGMILTLLFIQLPCQWGTKFCLTLCFSNVGSDGHAYKIITVVLL